jgi:hypothetical protein
MDIWLPKYKEIIIGGDNLPAITHSFKGEWRAKLTGPDGMVKYQTDWQPNLILWNGLYQLVRTTGNPWDESAVGDSAAAVDKTQGGLQGVELGRALRTNVTQYNEGSPNYGTVDVVKHVYGPGEGTGTIREMVLYQQFTSPITGGTARWLITPEIVKGALDELSIEHRMTFYPDLGQYTGTFDISGTSYDYWLQCTRVDTSTFRPSDIVPSGSNTTFNLALMDDQVSAPATLYPALTGANWGSHSNSTNANEDNYTSGTIVANDEYWGNCETVFDIDTANGEFDLAEHGILGLLSSTLGVGYIFRKTSDGSPLLKENTHELRMNIRGIAKRYP